jgi:hypothetical protein
MKEYDVTIEGTTPLLFNRFIQASIESQTKKRSGAVAQSDAENKLYKDGNGKICVPSTWVYGCLVESAKNFKIQGKMKATYSKLVGSTIKVNPEMAIVSPQSWIPYTISAVNPMTRGRMMVTRPRMDAWKLTFRIEFNEDDIPIEVVKNIIDYAGNYVGIGDWRPAKKGQFGKFLVSKFEEAE